MCFSTEHIPIMFMSVYAGLQDKCNTVPELSGNYHWWIVDTETGKIIDPSPNYDGTCPDWTTGERRYFHFREDTIKQKYRYLKNHFVDYYNSIGQDFMTRCGIIGKLNQYKSGKCFENALGFILDRDDDKYNLVCGACGYEMISFNGNEPFPHMNEKTTKYINLDWGY